MFPGNLPLELFLVSPLEGNSVVLVDVGAIKSPIWPENALWSAEFHGWMDFFVLSVIIEENKLGNGSVSCKVTS